ncbi:hypothetical protein SLA2020_201450 [Shorea laevis]
MRTNNSNVEDCMLDRQQSNLGVDDDGSRVAKVAESSLKCLSLKDIHPRKSASHDKGVSSCDLRDPFADQSPNQDSRMAGQ